MFDYFCFNCFSIVGKWKAKIIGYDIKKYCDINKEYDKNGYGKSLFCKKCNNCVGTLYHNVCIKCFGNKTIVGNNKTLKKWFKKYEITQQSINDTGVCYTCKESDFRKKPQPWFIEIFTVKKLSEEFKEYVIDFKKENKIFLYD